MSNSIRIEDPGVPHVARVVIDQAAAANAFTIAMCREFTAVLEALAVDDDIKVIVIDAAGTDLSVGLDAEEVGVHHQQIAGLPDDRIPSLRARLRAAADLFWGSDGLYSRLLGSPKVTVLAAKGRCFDVGLNLTLFCDIVVAGSDAVFGNPRWQHVGADGDVSMLLATVGRKRANELLFAGARWVAEQALSAGLVNRVTNGPDPADGALDVARTVSTIMRDGIAAEKYLTLASTEKLGVGAGFATATYMSAMAATVHFRPGEFNFLRARRDLGVAAAVEQAEQAKRTT